MFNISHVIYVSVVMLLMFSGFMKAFDLFIPIFTLILHVIEGCGAANVVGKSLKVLFPSNPEIAFF